MKPPLQIPAVIESLRTLKDGSIKISIETQEMNQDDAAVLFGYRNSYGFLLFKEAEFSESDISDVPDIVPEFKDDKSPSKRLRGVLYRVWERHGQGETWEQWYPHKMEEIIEHYKEKYLS